MELERSHCVVSQFEKPSLCNKSPVPVSLPVQDDHDLSAMFKRRGLTAPPSSVGVL